MLLTDPLVLITAFLALVSGFFIGLLFIIIAASRNGKKFLNIAVLLFNILFLITVFSYAFNRQFLLSVFGEKMLTLSFFFFWIFMIAFDVASFWSKLYRSFSSYFRKKHELSERKLEIMRQIDEYKAQKEQKK